MNFENLRQRLLGRLLPVPVRVRHGEYSMILSVDDDVGPSPFLIELSLRCIKVAQAISLKDLSQRMKEPPYYPDVWPGEALQAAYRAHSGGGS